MYKSPIDIIYGQMETQMEGDILRAIQRYGINVDKEELLRALQYDRGQYEKGYADGKAAQEWISVKDRLPEAQERVLTVDDSGYVVVNCISIRFGGWFSNAFGEKRITHWMPLPQPPKGE